MNPELKFHFRNILNQKDLIFSSVHGGDISQAYKIRTSHHVYFCKVNILDFADNFRIESESLKYLDGKSTLQVPQHTKTGNFKNYTYLLMDYIPKTSTTREFWTDFGRGLALLHKSTNTQFGYWTTTYIGSIQLTNQWHKEWTDFYFSERLVPLMMSALDLGIFKKSDVDELESIMVKLDGIIPREVPALCHGDLWSGNYICHNNDGYLIDPSLCYYHREMDLAMTKLFGGFDAQFYEAYHDEYPWAPGIEDRLDIHQLYYLLVHAILFGGGYTQSVKSIIQKYC